MVLGGIRADAAKRVARTADPGRVGVPRRLSARIEDVPRARRSRAWCPRARLANARHPDEPRNPLDCLLGEKTRSIESRGRTFVADVLQQMLRRSVRRGVLHHEQNLRSGAGHRGKSGRRGVRWRSSAGLDASENETIALGFRSPRSNTERPVRSVSRERRGRDREESASGSFDIP